MYILAVIPVLLFLFFFLRDNRSLWNPPLFIFALASVYLSLAAALGQFNSTAPSVFLLAPFALFPLLVFLSAFFLIYNGIVLIKKEGRSKANFLSIGLGLLILLFFLLVFFYFSDSSRTIRTHPWLCIPFMFFFYSCFIFGFAFFSYMLYSALYLIVPKRKHYDFIIIHGAGLLGGERVTPLLKRRIDKAVEAFHRSSNPDVMLIASGGRGPDEKISEAEAICQYLVTETDVPADRILLEDRSKNTYENLLFSKKIGQTYIAYPRFLFVTNDYHLYRTGTYARQLGMKADGLGCKTAGYYIPSAFIREFIAICLRIKWVFVLLYALFIILILNAYRGILW